MKLKPLTIPEVLFLRSSFMIPPLAPNRGAARLGMAKWRVWGGGLRWCQHCTVEMWRYLESKWPLSCLYWKGPCFAGFKPQNGRQTTSTYMIFFISIGCIFSWRVWNSPICFVQYVGLYTVCVYIYIHIRYTPGLLFLALFRMNRMIRLHQTPNVHQHLDEPVQCKLLGPASVVFQQGVCK